MAYDPKCYELAEHFLPSGPQTERLRGELAQHVQDAVEEWIAMEAVRLATLIGSRPASH